MRYCPIARCNFFSAADKLLIELLKLRAGQARTRVPDMTRVFLAVVWAKKVNDALRKM
jgi:hypothetical protein